MVTSTSSTKKNKVTKHQVLQYYKNCVKQYTLQFDDKALDSVQVNKIAKQLLGKIFIGVYSVDTVPDLPDKAMCIFNTDKAKKSGTHWMALYKSKNNYYIYDSFGRHTKNVATYLQKQILKIDKAKVIDFEHDREQAEYQANCGIRCIIALHCVQKFGIRKALSI
jgi:hypothetical protein